MIFELIGRLFGHNYISVAAVKLHVVCALLSEHLVDVRVTAAKRSWAVNSALVGVSIVGYVINNLLHWIGRLVCLIMQRVTRAGAGGVSSLIAIHALFTKLV